MCVAAACGAAVVSFQSPLSGGSRMKRSLYLAMAAGLAAAAAPAVAQQTVIFSTGRPNPTISNGPNTSLGWSWGPGPPNPERGWPQIFVFPAGGATIGQIDAVGFIATAYNRLNWKIWNRLPGDP